MRWRTRCGDEPAGLAAISARLLWSGAILLNVTLVAVAEPVPPQQLEFFESQVRPLLIEHCYQCHSAEADEVAAGLRLDTKAGWTVGGDSGPAIVPGQPEQSLLIEAVGYEENIVSGMPPKSKLGADQIAILQRWIEMGAPDPRSDLDAEVAKIEFDVQGRVASHWSWQPIRVSEPPPTEVSGWSESPLDRFVLARLEQAGLAPAPAASRRIWLRRVYLDLIGLPPSLEQIQQFLADDSPGAYQRVVDQLLDSPHFGEKWARHWLDLVRYSETYGHEFDYPIRAAHEYRDYVIRAFNADLPYDQFVREQIAGDRIDPPRRHPTADFNESIIGTGFWYLHDATHAPTDVLGNEADIMDNQIDVFGKAFLGLTVACARCHDHKFDAISTADYYALTAYLQSSCRQYFPLDPGGKIASLSAGIETRLRQADQQLAAAVSGLALEDETIRQVLAAWDSLGLSTPAELADDCRLLEDFESPSLPAGWSRSGPAFEVVSDRLLAADGKPLRAGTVSSRVLGRQQQGILRSPTFEISSPRIHVRMRATAGIKAQVIIDNYQMTSFSPLLFKGTLIDGQAADTKDRWQWLSFGGDLQKYVGHRGYLEFVDEGEGFVEIDRIVLSNQPPPDDVAWEVDGDLLKDRWREATQNLSQFSADPLFAALVEHDLLSIQAVSVPADQALAEAITLGDQIPPPRYALAMAEGTTEPAHIYVRGSHTNLGSAVPPRWLSALGGESLNRLELADRVASRDNPLTARVMVNRLWHHLFGRGIVPTVDDFGPQGQPPSHPELLDWLADDFLNHGWSIKHTIARIALSQTYRQASTASDGLTAAQIDAADPLNQLLHRMPLRRLPAETIRDSLLQISGQLNRQPFGASVPTHLTSFMTGRGRPASSGPLDGNGRRSIYLAVTRNFLNPFMLTFDMPTPFGPQGRRSESNVPAQALTLMNDPLVIDQATKWADRMLAIPGLDARHRAALMIEQAHGVEPSESQLDAAQRFLAQQSSLYGEPDSRAWSDLAHALLNMKAFYFVR